MRYTQHILLLTTLMVGPVQAQLNHALEFDGVDDHVDLGPALGNMRSIEFWFRPAVTFNSSTTLPGMTLLSRATDTSSASFSFYLRGTDWANGRGSLRFNRGGPSNNVWSTSTTWAAGTWYHVCGVFDAGDGMKLYINGNDQDVLLGMYTNPIPAAIESTELGIWADSLDLPFHGRIDELRIWDRTLTEEEIGDHQCYWLDPDNSTGLIHYWRMDEGTGIVLGDAFGTNDGQITGATYVEDPLCFSGVLDVGEQRQVSAAVFPNPMTERTVVRFDRPVTNATAWLYDGQGRQVRVMRTLRGDQMVLEREGLPAGVYSLEVMDEQMRRTTRRVLIADL
jgi:Concanavalin A-like lectin/glucanases superfamily